MLEAELRVGPSELGMGAGGAPSAAAEDGDSTWEDVEEEDEDMAAVMDHSDMVDARVIFPIAISYSICLQTEPTNKHSSDSDPYLELACDYLRTSARARVSPYSEYRNWSKHRSKQSGNRNWSKQTGIGAKQGKTREHWNGTKLGHCVLNREFAPTLSFVQ